MCEREFSLFVCEKEEVLADFLYACICEKKKGFYQTLSDFVYVRKREGFDRLSLCLCICGKREGFDRFSLCLSEREKVLTDFLCVCGKREGFDRECVYGETFQTFSVRKKEKLHRLSGAWVFSLCVCERRFCQTLSQFVSVRKRGGFDRFSMFAYGNRKGFN